MSKTIVKHEFVEIVIPAGSTNTQFKFPDLPNLRWVDLYAIQAYYDNIIPFGWDSQDVVISKGDMQLACLNLQDYDGDIFCQQLPLVTLQTIENSLSGYTTAGVVVNYPPTIQEKDFKSFNGQKVNWPKSTVNFAQAVTAQAYDRVVALSIYYKDPNDKKKPATFATKK